MSPNDRHIRHETTIYFTTDWLKTFPVTDFIDAPELHVMTAERHNIPVIRDQGRKLPIACYHTAPHDTRDEAAAEEHGDSLTNRSFAH